MAPATCQADIVPALACCPPVCSPESLGLSTWVNQTGGFHCVTRANFRSASCSGCSVCFLSILYSKAGFSDTHPQGNSKCREGWSASRVWWMAVLGRVFRGCLGSSLQLPWPLSLRLSCLLTTWLEGKGKGPTDSFAQAYLTWFSGLLGTVGETWAGDSGSVVCPTSGPPLSWDSLCTSFLRPKEINIVPIVHSQLLRQSLWMFKVLIKCSIKCYFK